MEIQFQQLVGTLEVMTYSKGNHYEYFLIHDYETESALVWFPMCCLEGCERESFSDLKEPQNIQTKNSIAVVIHFGKESYVKLKKFVKRISLYYKEQ